MSAQAIHTRSMAIRGVSSERREASFVASTDAIDSYGEIVVQNWSLKRYRANPIVLYAHQSRELPIGRCTFVDVVGGRLECTIAFAEAAANPRAEQVWQLYKAGVIRGVSVGFIPNTVRTEKRDGQEVYLLDDNDLLEISVVPIPANPEALAKMWELRAKAAPPVRERPPLEGGYELAAAVERLAMGVVLEDGDVDALVNFAMSDEVAILEDDAPDLAVAARREADRRTTMEHVETATFDGEE